MLLSQCCGCRYDGCLFLLIPFQGQPLESQNPETLATALEELQTGTQNSLRWQDMPSYAVRLLGRDLNQGHPQAKCRESKNFRHARQLRISRGFSTQVSDSPTAAGANSSPEALKQALHLFFCASAELGLLSESKPRSALSGGARASLGPVMGFEAVTVGFESLFSAEASSLIRKYQSPHGTRSSACRSISK